MLRESTFVVGALVAGAALTAQQVDVNALGPQVGQKAIDFRLTDQRGNTRTLESLAGSKGTMLVFFRSADW
jgi:cytochrome oxidase Cu insertion factor (SCO1/SenC/PrrC family)